MRDWLRVPAAVLLAAALAAPAHADVKDGVDAWSRGDYAAAIAEWRGAAAAGDPDAQFNLAQAYKLGKGVPADRHAAEELYLEAARQGHVQAADNYGLMLFQSGRRIEAMAWVVPSADRGEPRAQYVLGTAYFNGDLVPNDAVRAYALMTRAAAAGLEQARASLATMDQHIALDQRQKAIELAGELEARAAGLRGAQLAAADLAPGPSPVKRFATRAKPAKSPPAPVAMPLPLPVAIPAPVAVAVAPAPTPAPAAAVAAPADGPWRVQLGAFSVPGAADALWVRLKAEPALAGRTRFLVPAGKLTRLHAGPFATKAAADAACAALAGQPCIAVRT